MSPRVDVPVAGCAICGGDFTRKKSSAKYCSRKCLGQANGRRRQKINLLDFSANGTALANGCLEWKFARDKDQYGTLTIGRVKRRAHDVAYEKAFGPLQPGHFACHFCDNPPCIQPDHLFAGTPLANAQDMARKDRVSHGQGHHCAKLTEDDVRYIRTALMSARRLAVHFGVAANTVRKIRSGATWRRLA